MLTSSCGAGVLAQWRGSFVELQAADGSLRERASASTSDADTGFCEFVCDGPVYVGVPSMAALCQHLGRTPGLTVSWGARVHPCQLQVLATVLQLAQPYTKFWLQLWHACLL